MENDTLNFDQFQEIVNLGARRAAVFMGFGINSAYDNEQKNFDFSNITSIQIVSSEIDDATMKTYKEEYASWIIGCGLREIIETFSVFLDSIFEACILMSSNKQIFLKNSNNVIGEYRRTGIEHKLEFLQNQYNVKTTYSDCLVSINQARNCLTHRRGLVSKFDTKKEDSLTVLWMGTRLFSENEEGIIIEIEVPLPIGGIALKKGAALKVQYVKKARRIMIGEVIRLLPKDIAEICSMIPISAAQIIDSCLSYGNNIGIEVIRT